MDYSRVSISVYITGSSGGETGPIGFLTDGRKLYISYTDDYLISYGDEYVSMISMTDNGYIKLEYW